MGVLKKELPKMRPADVIETLVKQIKYKEYLIKEE
jgi:hypothetical protein